MTEEHRVRNKWKWGLYGLGAAAIIGLSSTALYSTVSASASATVYAQAETAETEAADAAVAAPRHERLFALGEEHSALLAQALGISEAELEAAQTEVRNAAIDQAVENGRITQEEADQLKAGEIGEARHGRGRGLMPFGWLGGALMEASADHEEALAAALDITLEELQAAKAEIPALRLAEAVEAGEITQEEADLIAARMALHGYMQELEQSAYEESVADAVAAGVITQEQADQILSEGDRGFFGRGRFGLGEFGRGRFGHGNFGPGGFDPNGFGWGMEGGERGWRFGGPQGGPEGGRFGWPGRDHSPENASPESSSAPPIEIPASDL